MGLLGFLKSFGQFSVFKKRVLGSVFSVLSATALVVSFQNCGQSGSIGTSSEAVLDDTGAATFPQYAEKGISSNAAPPLKIVFLMDNSNSMTISNLNLQNSIRSMFSSQADSLSQFNADLYFFTTAQLSKLGIDFALKTRTPALLNGQSLGQIESQYRSPFTGLIAGDLLGFSTTRTTTPQSDTIEFRPQPVVQFSDMGSERVISSSIRYNKGSSIDLLQAQIEQRLSIISPALASGISDVQAFQPLDTESALCGLSRILKDSNSVIQPGDVSSFIIVSDENDADPSGANCIEKRSREFLYQATCQRQIASQTINQTTIQYQTLPGADSYRMVYSIKTPSQIRNRVETSLTLSRAAQNAVCRGTQQREFLANFQQVNRTYRITYNRRPLTGYREGGIPVYGSEQTNLNTPNQSGVVPSDCATNLSRLSTILGDTTSALTIVSCSQNSDTISNQTRRLAYSNHLEVNLTQSTACSGSVVTALTAGGVIIQNCSLSSVTAENISASALSARGFSSSGTQADCQIAVSRVCSESGGALRSCAFVSHTAAITADIRGPVTATADNALDCNSTCATFAGLCATNNTTPVSNFAASIGYTCSSSTRNSPQTYTVDGTAQTVTVTQAVRRSCSSTCQEVPQACGGNNNTQMISSFNQACSVSVTTVPGATSQNRTLGPVDDPLGAISCNTVCSSSNRLCTGGLTISQQIAQNLNGQGCSVTRGSRTIAGSTETQTVTRLRQSQLSDEYCPTGFTKVGSPSLTTQFEETWVKVSGDQNLSDFIFEKLRDNIGVKAATLSAFITPEGAGSGSTSHGSIYQSLVNRWGSGSVNDIRSPSYAPALAQLSSTLKSQLIRSVVFDEVKGKARIRQVWLRKRNEVEWRALQPTQWSATGGTVTLDAVVNLDLQDELRILYY